MVEPYLHLNGRRMILTDETEVNIGNVVQILRKALPYHWKNRSEISYLWSYYKGRQPILNRVKEVRPEITNKIVENRANEIVSFKSGYLMEDTAKDDRHGYCQTHRWGEDGDYDCSSAVYTAWEHAGIPVKTYSFEKYGCAYTGVMLAVFKHFGFEDVTNKVNLATGAGLKRSDILLNDKHHVAMYCGNGMEVEASINEKGTATGGTPGDQTGKEFLIRAYRNYPWNHVLRYPDGGSTSVTKKSVDEVAKEVLAGAWGNGDVRKNALTAAGYNYSEVQAAVNRLAGDKTTTPTKSITEVAKEVLAGKWGNGDDRKKKLEAAGYNYSQVQAKVNELAKGSTSSKKSVTQIAKEVIAGKWGNGTDRKNKLTAAGYDYTAVQKEVNRLL